MRQIGVEINDINVPETVSSLIIVETAQLFEYLLSGFLIDCRSLDFIFPADFGRQPFRVEQQQSIDSSSVEPGFRLEFVHDRSFHLAEERLIDQRLVIFRQNIEVVIREETILSQNHLILFINGVDQQVGKIVAELEKNKIYVLHAKKLAIF